MNQSEPIMSLSALADLKQRAQTELTAKSEK